MAERHFVPLDSPFEVELTGTRLLEAGAGELVAKLLEARNRRVARRAGELVLAGEGRDGLRWRGDDQHDRRREHCHQDSSEHDTPQGRMVKVVEWLFTFTGSDSSRGTFMNSATDETSRE